MECVGYITWRISSASFPSLPSLLFFPLGGEVGGGGGVGRRGEVRLLKGRVMQQHRFDPLQSLSVEGIFPFEVAWILTPFPRNSFR